MSGADLRDAGRRLTGDGRAFQALKPAPGKGGKPGTVSTGRPASGGGQTTGFAESDYTQRQYWPAVTLTSTDGIFTLQVEPIKQLSLDSGAVFTFKQPV